VAALPPVQEVDPFDLPEWLGEGEVTWVAESSLAGGPVVAGRLTGASRTGASRTGDPPGGEPLACDLLAADRAFPRPVLDETWRTEAHQAWTHGQVLLVEYGGRLTLLVPATTLDADRVLEALARLAKAVGVRRDRFVAALRL
jgi:hypothetical protein